MKIQQNDFSNWDGEIDPMDIEPPSSWDLDDFGDVVYSSEADERLPTDDGMDVLRPSKDLFQ